MKKNQYFALCLVGMVGSTQASSVFLDRDFDLDDYVVASHSNGGDTTVIVSNSSPGNPGTSIGHMTLVSANNPNHSSRNYFINSHFSWDPATQGNINTISASMDRWVAVEGGTLGSWGRTSSFSRRVTTTSIAI
ncbi:hypothetical protein OLMES_5244 [Oleiphilus messinensis]|uniref:Uncharacterized protein n=1 Tax=Oleiphilus messinensis TaxID=141451 RepID=A0A1Y0IFD6_9GAMM|nr:hypothetical protein [Oleiphilus messinensis]ARU59228.1 hypothetical protein OLMES_5244 [Oleiphilus messinensis]